MSKKFIQVDHGRVMLIHNMPFDPINGMGKTEEQLLQMGVLLDEIPEPEQIPDKTALPYYNETDGFYYVYEDAPAGPATEQDILGVNAKIDYLSMMMGV